MQLVPETRGKKKECSIEDLGSAFKIRQMEIQDIPGVLIIERVSFPSPWSENIFREEIQSLLCRCLVATINDHVVGYIDFSVVWDEIHLRNIAVHPACRKNGIASMLLTHMMVTTSNKGAQWATLEVRRSNVGAIKLYEKFGFVLTGIRPLYYRDTREDALIMWADLTKKPRNAEL